MLSIVIFLSKNVIVIDNNPCNSVLNHRDIQELLENLYQKVN